MKNFAITGIAGYIAPRHLKAIKETGNRLVAAMDPHDSVGIMDSYFPQSSFFTEFERFDRHLEKLRKDNKKMAVDYLSICSPNNLHDAHIRLALRIGADAICEKPLVLNPWNLDALQALEEEYGKKVWTLLQLRAHSSIIKLKNKLEQEKTKKRKSVKLKYITSRGLWYDYSWKGDESKSGGVATNIGVHFFDMLTWFFGDAESMELYIKEPNKTGGHIQLKNADVEWYLSLDSNDLPLEAEGKTTYRSITIDGEEIEFSGGFTDLHTKVYENTLAGKGFGIEDARPAIDLVHKLRNMKVSNKTSSLL